jgi:hypothetical protein
MREGWVMFTRGKVWITGLMLLLIAVSAQAQVPAIPAAPAAPAAAGAVPAAAPAGHLWSLICMTPDQKANLKNCFCNSALGKMISTTAGPLALYSGGLLGSFCPTGPTAADLASPADSPGGAAARIKQQEAEAKKRRADVRYLGTVDCHRFPEAEAALISALRGDTNECVRLEAALALNRGCCCTKPIIDALTATVTGSTKDNFPEETSQRVRSAAMDSLQHCLACYRQKIDPVPPEKPAGPARPEQPMTQVTSYAAQGDIRPAAYPVAPEPAAPAAAPVRVGHSLFEVFQQASVPAASNVAPQGANPPVPAKRHDLFSVLRNW